MAPQIEAGGFGGETSLATEVLRVQAAARQEPAKAAHRSALAQLHFIAGAWDKASVQLAVLADLDPEAQLFCTQGRLLLACEAERAEVLGGRSAPSCLGEPPEWMALLTEALRLDGAGEHASAKELRDRAFAQATATAGQVDG